LSSEVRVIERAGCGEELNVVSFDHDVEYGEINLKGVIFNEEK
jgi:hypothetical protein